MAQKMDATLLSDWEGAYQAGKLVPDDKAFWEQERGTYFTPEGLPKTALSIELIPEPEAVQKGWIGQFAEDVWGDVKYLYESAGGEPFVRPGSPAATPTPPDAAARSPLYKQLWERYIATPDYSVDVTTPVPTLVQPGTPPGKATDIQAHYTEGTEKGAAEALRWIPTVVAALKAPAAIAPGAYHGIRALFAEVGFPLLRATYMYLGQSAAETLAQILDPEYKTSIHDPAFWRDVHRKALAEGVGEGAGSLGGKALDAGGRAVDRGRERLFGETPMGTIHREVLEPLGEHPTIGMASEKRLPQALDVGLSRTLWTGRMQERYSSVGKVLDDELKRIQATHPGGKVTAERGRIAGEVATLGDERLLESVPRAVRNQLDTHLHDALPNIVERDLKKGYADLDANYFQRQVPWSTVKGGLPSTRALQQMVPQTGSESLLGQATRLVENMRLFDQTVTLDTAMDMQRTVDRFLTDARAQVARLPADDPQRAVLASVLDTQIVPLLTPVQDKITALVAPYMVTLGAARREAQRIVETSGVPEAVLQGQLAAGNVAGTLVDPNVLLAYKLLQAPELVNFSEAHALRSDLLKGARLPGPTIGESSAKESAGMARLVDASMRAMGERLDPTLVPAWRVMNTKYEGMASLYNSEYISGVMDMRLDDIVTQLIRLDRPNDIKALREALGKTPQGGDLLDDVAQMWLTNRLEMATPRSTGQANIDEVLTTLDSMNTRTQEALFPGLNLTAVRDRLRQGKDMQDAVTIAGRGKDADIVELAQLKRRIGDPVKWQAVVSDTLHPMFKGDLDPIKPDHLLQRLQDLSDVKHVLFEPGHYESLTHLAHTARFVEETARSGKLHWSPTVRLIEHGGPAAAVVIGYMGSHPVLGSVLGAGYVLSARAMAWLMSNPESVKLLTRGLTNPQSSQRAMEITGLLIGQLYAQGLGHEVTQMPAPGGQQPAP